MIEQNTLRRRGTGLIAADPAAASPGFTLFAPLTGTGQVYLVDLDGVSVHRWDLPYRPGRHARILPGGNLAYNGTLPGGPALFPMWHKYHGGALCEVAPDGTIRVNGVEVARGGAHPNRLLAIGPAIDTLPGDRYAYHENVRKIVGQRTRREFSIG